MWFKRWHTHKRSVRKSLRNSALHRLFGERIFHRNLWRTDQTGIAGGLALGLFIAFTPTIPFQMLLAACGALLLKVNLPVAVLAVWVTNPITAIPVFMSAWKVGKIMLGPESPLANVLALFTPTGIAGKFMVDTAYLWGGSLLYAALGALIGYLMVHLSWQAAMRIAAARKNGFHPNPPVTLLLKTFFLMALIATGLIAQYHGWIDTPRMLERLQTENSRWLPLATIGIMIPLYTFALPAAPLMAMCGVLFHPSLATIIVFIGGTTGSIFAYFLSRKLAMSGMNRRKTKPGLVKRMREGTKFSSLFALRICPGVPHAAINYTAGALQIPLHLFIGSTAAGFIAKGVVYTTAVHRATYIDENTEIWSWHVLWPLVALLALALAGIWIERQVAHQKNKRLSETDDVEPLDI